MYNLSFLFLSVFPSFVIVLSKRRSMQTAKQSKRRYGEETRDLHCQTNLFRSCKSGSFSSDSNPFSFYLCWLILLRYSKHKPLFNVMQFVVCIIHLTCLTNSQIACTQIKISLSKDRFEIGRFLDHFSRRGRERFEQDSSFSNFDKMGKKLTR